MNLLVFLSDRCDLACDYCFLSLNEGAPTVLAESDAARAVDAHLERAGAHARVTILGGEPLLHPELALAVARRARAGGAKVTVVTNGTHASPETVGALLALGAEVSVSVDGPAEVHDRHRRSAGGGPSHAKVAAALARLDAAALRANLVVSEDTVGGFLGSLEWLRGRGLRRISFHADVARPWSEAGLRALGAALAGFGRYAKALGPGLSLWHLDSWRAPAEGPGDEDLVLGADGRYYASDAFLSKRYGSAPSFGDVRRGPDLAGIAAVAARADAGVRAALRGEDVYTWPRETWLLAELRGEDPAAAVASFAKADRLLGRALSPLAAEAAR